MKTLFTLAVEHPMLASFIFLVILASEPAYGRLRVFQQSVVAPSNGVVPREAA